MKNRRWGRSLCCAGALIGVNGWSFATTRFFSQRFTEPADLLAIGVRRRDGSTTMDAGYRHGEISSPFRPQARSLRPVCIDLDLVGGMILALQSGSATPHTK